MQNKTIFLYANQPVIRYGDSYYAKLNTFLDFLVELTKLSDAYHLMVPCKVLAHSPDEALTPVNIPDGVIECSYYVGHWQAIISSFRNALQVRSYVKNVIAKGGKVTFVGPGNSLIFWLSLIVPKSVCFAFIIRGNTLETLQRVFHGNPIYFIVTGMARLIRRRISSLVNQGRAQLFLFSDVLKDQYPGPESAIHVIYPKIDTSFVRSNTRLSIPEGRPLKVLYVGRFSMEKNILALIDACVIASKSGHPFILSIVGYGKLEEEIRDRISNSGLSNLIRIIGYVPHGDALISEFDRHDLFCLPSHTEGFPRVVVEAFARGMPVLATPVGNMPALFPEEIRFLDGFEVEDILKGIYWCDSHRSEFSAMGRKGQNAIHPFLIHENASRVDKLLQSFK